VSFAFGYSTARDYTSTKSSKAGVFAVSTNGPEMFFRLLF